MRIFFPFGSSWKVLIVYTSKVEDCHDFPICYVSVKITFRCGNFCSWICHKLAVGTWTNHITYPSFLVAYNSLSVQLTDTCNTFTCILILLFITRFIILFLKVYNFWTIFLSSPLLILIMKHLYYWLNSTFQFGIAIFLSIHSLLSSDSILFTAIILYKIF